MNTTLAYFLILRTLPSAPGILASRHGPRLNASLWSVSSRFISPGTVYNPASRGTIMQGQPTAPSSNFLIKSFNVLGHAQSPSSTTGPSTFPTQYWSNRSLAFARFWHMPSEILSARQIHALIAAGLGNPGLLDLWRRDPDTLSRAGIEPLDIDLEALRRFSGLATKVRHPDLRDTLPLTFRSLECAGLEIDAFAGYTAIATTLRRVKTTTLSDKVSAFVTFLESWLDVDDPDHLLIEHISRHEAALARLKHQITIGGTAIEGGGGWPTAQTIVRICGTLILCEFALDPCRASEMVPPGVKALPRLPRKRFRLGYWW